MPTSEDQTQGQTPESEGQENPFKENCFGLRNKIDIIRNEVGILKLTPVFKVGGLLGHETSEMAANLQLAYRHLEDARMRIGKAVQAYDGGQSCYLR